MARFPFRTGRSRSVWEDGNPEEIARLQFPKREGGLDHSPSAYSVEHQEAVRARAEHLVSFRGPPFPAGGVDFDLSDLGTFHPTPGPTKFQFTTERHVEMQLASDDEVITIVEILIREPARRLEQSLDAVMGYVDTQLTAGDPEWTQFVRENPKWKKYLVNWKKNQPLPN